MHAQRASVISTGCTKLNQNAAQPLYVAISQVAQNLFGDGSSSFLLRDFPGERYDLSYLGGVTFDVAGGPFAAVVSNLEVSPC